MTRCGGQYEIVEMPERFAGLVAVTIPRRNSREPASEFEFTANKPVMVYLLVHDRGDFTPEQWEKPTSRLNGCQTALHIPIPFINVIFRRGKLTSPAIMANPEVIMGFRIWQ